MGCGVAAALATDADLGPNGVMMVTPWDALLNEVRAKFPWLPAESFLHDSYDNVENLSKYNGPIAVIMSRQDEVIPNTLTKRL